MDKLASQTPSSHPAMAAASPRRRSRSNGSATMPGREDLLTTTVLVNNLHCVSCVSHISEALNALEPPPTDVNANVLTHEVIVKHRPILSTEQIVRQLSEAAFELHSVVTIDEDGDKIMEIDLESGPRDGWLEHAAGQLTKRASLGFLPTPMNDADAARHIKRTRHVANCAACQSDDRHMREKPRTLANTGRGQSSRIPSYFRRASHPQLEPTDSNIPLAIASSKSSNTNFDLEGQQATESKLGPSSRQLHFAESPAHHRDQSIDNAKQADSPKGTHDGQSEQDYVEAALSIGGMTCASCTSAITRGLEELPFVGSANVSLITNSASVTLVSKENLAEAIEKIEDLGYECSLQDWISTNATKKRIASSKAPASTSQVVKATFSIAGMTCASCVGALREGLQELPFVQEVDINLLSNRGTAVFEDPSNVNKITEKVDDLGYEAFIEQVVPIGPGIETASVDASQQIETTVTINVDGMFCEHCPPRIVAALESAYGSLITIDRLPSLKEPRVTISYEPCPPDFTIRNIMKTLTDLDNNFSPTIYHAPSIEERSRVMQRLEQRRLLLRLLLSFIVAIPTLLIGVVWMSLVSSSNMIRKYFEEPLWTGKATRADWALFFLATPVFFFAADVFHVRTIKEIRALWRRGSKTPILKRFYRFGSMNLLISAGTSVAYFASIAVLIVQATQKRHDMDMRAESMTTYFDSVVFLTMFILIGRFLEAYSKARTGDAVAMLGKLRPTQALLCAPQAQKEGNSDKSSETTSQNHSQKIEVDLLEAGDVIMIPLGSTTPADGVIISEETLVDESSLTGESRPVKKTVGEQFFAGTVNQGKVVNVRLSRRAGDSMLDQIIKVVREGQTKRAPVERVADIITGYFVPVITLIAIVTFLIWCALGESGAIPTSWRDTSTGGWPFWALQFAIAVFVVACPCGIGLAAPTALFVGSGLAAEYGILVRGGGEAFQEASLLDVVVFDKTGTLTEGGTPSVTDYDVFVSDESHRACTWAIARALEESSSHPIAKAVVAFCQHQKMASILSADIEEIPGRGLRGIFTIAGTPSEPEKVLEAAIGSETYIQSLGIDTSAYFLSSNIAKWNNEGKSAALIAISGLSQEDSASSESKKFILAAQLATADPIRPEAAHVITQLHKQGLAVYMLSGDNPATARAVGAQVGIPAAHIIAGVLPDQKADQIRWLQTHAPKRGHHGSADPQQQHKQPHRAIVAFLGDGINDAPALSAADVSIAIGSGADIALSTAKFVLLRSSLRAVLTLTALSRAVFRRVKINFAWALVYNVVLVPVAAGVLFDVGGERHWRLGPVWASLAMALSSVSVVGSSLLLRVRWWGVGFRAGKEEEGM